MQYQYYVHVVLRNLWKLYCSRHVYTLGAFITFYEVYVRKFILIQKLYVIIL